MIARGVKQTGHFLVKAFSLSWGYNKNREYKRTVKTTANVFL